MNERQAAIHRFITERGACSVDELARRFRVSRMTARRDLAALAARGVVARTHGGAMLARSGIIEFKFANKNQRNAEAKAAIAASVTDMIRPGMSVSLDTGTTTLAIARALAKARDIKVLTSSLAIASALYANDGIELVLLGGAVRKGNPDLTGPLAEENMGRFHVDMAVLGADALKPDGVFANDLSVARLCKVMIQRANRVVIAADAAKFDATAFVKYADWSDVDVLVTAPAVPVSARRWADRRIRHIVSAKP